MNDKRCFLLCTSVCVLFLLGLGWLVYQYMSEKNEQLRTEIEQLRTEIVQLQKENQYLRNGGSTSDKLLFCVTTARGVTSVMAGVAHGVVAPSSPYQIMMDFIYWVLGSNSTTSTPQIESEKVPVSKNIREL